MAEQPQAVANRDLGGHRARTAAPRSGIDRLLADQGELRRLAGLRLGLLTNQACRTASGAAVASALAAAIGQGERGLVRLFAPEHGVSGALAEGMADGRDTATGLAVHSLYGPRRAPDAAALADLDLLAIDLRDVGVRCYTYGATAALLLAAWHAQAGPRGGGRTALLLDRANPLGPRRAGCRLDPRYRSFVGYFAEPFQHGATLGELLQRWAGATLPGLELTLLPADAAPPPVFVPPSPSLTEPDAVRLYPGLVLLEGTNVGEGRGSALPFRAVFAPGLDADALARAIAGWRLGIAAMPLRLVPQSGKLAGQTCAGVALTPQEDAPALSFGIALLDWLKRHYSTFRWTESTIMTTEDGRSFAPRAGYLVDYLIGDGGLRADLERGADRDALLAKWAA